MELQKIMFKINITKTINYTEITNFKFCQNEKNNFLWCLSYGDYTFYKLQRQKYRYCKSK